MRLNRVALAALAVLGAGCGVARPNQLGDPECPDYDEKLRPMLVRACGECHTGSSAAGNYAVGEYQETTGRRWDGRAILQPGAPDSLFLRAVRGELSGHPQADEETIDRLGDWAVRCRAAPRHFGWHEKGWLTPVDDQAFHGKYLRGGGDAGTPYPFEECATCHGDDLKGGKSEKSCETCHTEGVTTCNTCHGGGENAAPPRALNGAWGFAYLGVGAHQSHVKPGPLGKSFDCDVCHRKPQEPSDDGHWRNGALRDVAVAEVKLFKSGPAGEARWSRTEATCANGYCHAPNQDDTAAALQTPKWTLVGEGQADCGTCHGAPPSSHADDRCEVCHGLGDSKTAPDPLTHLDFKLDLRGDGSDCGACHSAPMSRNFIDLHQATDPTLRSVGAHEKHLSASRFRGPLNCTECHKVPTELHTPGHIDSKGPAEVFTTGQGLAYADFSTPSYDPATGSCGAYCHGAGRRAAKDTASTKATSPVWNGPADQVVCGSCHGVPPLDGTVAHTGRSMSECVNCHGLSVDGQGQIRFSVDPATGVVTSTHLDGKLTGSQ